MTKLMGDLQTLQKLLALSDGTDGKAVAALHIIERMISEEQEKEIKEKLRRERNQLILKQVQEAAAQEKMNKKLQKERV